MSEVREPKPLRKIVSRQQGVANIIANHIEVKTNSKKFKDQMSTQPWLKKADNWDYDRKTGDSVKAHPWRYYQDEPSPYRRALDAVQDMWRGRPLNMSKSIRSVPLDKLETPQHTVSRGVVIDKIQGEFKKGQKETPRVPIILHNRKTDKYTLMDGNHRVVGRSARGFKAVRGFVLPDHRENE